MVSSFDDDADNFRSQTCRRTADLLAENSMKIEDFWKPRQGCFRVRGWNLTQSPVVALALPAPFAWNFDEAFVQAQVVSNRVLPALLVLLEIRKPLGNVIVDLAQRRTLVRRVLGRRQEERSSNLKGMSLSIKKRLISARERFSYFPAPFTKSSKYFNLLVRCHLSSLVFSLNHAAGSSGTSDVNWDDFSTFPALSTFTGIYGKRDSRLSDYSCYSRYRERWTFFSWTFFGLYLRVMSLQIKLSVTKNLVQVKQKPLTQY